MGKNRSSILNRIVVIGFLLLSFVIVAGAQEERLLLEPEKAPQIIPLHNLDCPIDYMADGSDGSSKFDKIYSFSSCYNKFLRTGKDESICGQFSELEQQWTTPPALESKTNDCYYGFALAKNDYRICDSISVSEKDNCYTDVAIISHNTLPCTFLKSDSKKFCFTLVGPISNSTWISWFLFQTGLYLIIGLTIFIISSLFIKSYYKKDLIILSLLLVFLELIIISILDKEFTTSTLYLLVLVPSISLFLSAFVIKGFDLMLQKTSKKLLIFIGTILIGVFHGFLTPIQPFYKAYGSDIFMFGGIFFISIANAIMFFIVYTLFYFWIMKKVQKRKSLSS